MSFESDVVIGLEVHAELDTKSKLFCGCARTGTEEPNTRTCPVCLGHPGAKPVLNRKAVEHAARLALALGCDVDWRLVFSRKSYFYPDMAKNFQISQYEMPLAINGSVQVSGRDIGLVRLHMEEDPAALVHPQGMGRSGHVLVDYNRSGNPLVEVVSKPEIFSPKEAREFMKNLISVLEYLKVWDRNTCTIKADANVSIRESGYVRVEIKNISGQKEIERALAYEISRQRKESGEGRRIAHETRAWDSDTGITRPLRVKETEEDYGYIAEPDLVMTDISDEWLEKIRSTLPELAHEKRERFIRDYGIERTDAVVISAQMEIAELFERVSEEVSPVLAARWLRRELARVMNYSSLEFADLRIDETHLIDLLRLVEDKKITENVAQKLLEKLVSEPFDVSSYVKEHNLGAVTDAGALEGVCREVVGENPKVVSDYCSGNEKSLHYLMGQVMKKTGGRASPKEVRSLLVRMLK